MSKQSTQNGYALKHSKALQVQSACRRSYLILIHRCSERYTSTVSHRRSSSNDKWIRISSKSFAVSRWPIISRAIPETARGTSSSSLRIALVVRSARYRIWTSTTLIREHLPYSRRVPRTAPAILFKSMIRSTSLIREASKETWPSTKTLYSMVLHVFCNRGYWYAPCFQIEKKYYRLN